MDFVRVGAGVVTAGVVLALGVAGCGSQAAVGTTVAIQPPPPTVEISIDRIVGPGNLGILFADRRGYFKRAGLDVYVTFLNPLRPVRYVREGETDIAVSHEPEVALARAEGAHVISIASVLPQATASLIWLRGAGIHRIADLRGKTIAIPGLPSQKALLEISLKRAGVEPSEVHIKRVAANLIPVLESGRAQAIFGGSGNVDGAALEAEGLHPVVTHVRSSGVPNYEELVLITRPAFAEKEPATIRKILAATFKGIETAIGDPEAAAHLVAYIDDEPVRVARAEVAASLPLLSRTGRMNPRRARAMLIWMWQHGMVRKRLAASDILTNAYLNH